MEWNSTLSSQHLTPWLAEVLGRILFFMESWNSHCWVTAQGGVAQEAVPHYSKCLWPNNNCSSSCVLLIYKCILWKPRFSVTVKKKKKKKKYPTLFNRLSLSDTCLCTPLAIVMWGFAPSIGLIALEKPFTSWIQPKSSVLKFIHPAPLPWILYTQDHDNFWCGERDIIHFTTLFKRCG